MADHDVRAPRGRPRDPAIDAAVLDVTRQLLEERGFAGTTVQEIAKRAGVHPPGIYRRWPSRLALIEDAAFSTLTDIDFAPSGDLRADLRRFLQEYERNLGSPSARAAIPGLLAAYQHDEPAPPAQWMHLTVRPQFYEILRAAGDDVDPDLDPDQAFDLVLGAILARVLVPPVASRRRWLDATTDQVVKVVRRAPTPAPAPAPGSAPPARARRPEGRAR